LYDLILSSDFFDNKSSVELNPVIVSFWKSV